MSLTSNSKFMSFNLRLPNGRWDLTSAVQSHLFLELVSLSIAWRADGVRRPWNGDLHDALISGMPHISNYMFRI
jgi:hypothetical protein